MAEAEVVWLICRSTSTTAPTVPGSTREYCLVCGEEVWVSPASKARGERFEAVCTECAPGLLETTGESVAPPSPEQWREVRDHLR